MDKQYIQITDPSVEEPRSLTGGFMRLQHKANPDFEALYASVRTWYLEVDNNLVTREIGIDSAREPIVLGPFRRNSGIWMALSGTIRVTPEREAPITKALFEESWQRLARSLWSVPTREEPTPKPIDDERQLEGLWSEKILCLPGSVSDTLVAFLPDRRGFCAEENVVLAYYDTFDWCLSRVGVVTIRGDKRFGLDGKGQLLEKPSFTVSARSVVQKRRGGKRLRCFQW
jgi:hypothetical protein